MMSVSIDEVLRALPRDVGNILTYVVISAGILWHL